LRASVQNRKWLRSAFVVLLLSSPGYGEALADHRSESPEASDPPAAKKNTASPRGVLLSEGLRQAGLGVPALKAVEQAFRISPDVDSERFDGVINQLEKDRGIVSRAQAEDLKRLYREALSGVPKNAGKEVSDAARALLQQTATNAPVTSALKGDEGARPPDNVSALEDKLGNAASQKENATADDFLSERGVLNLIQNLLGKENEGERSSKRDEASAPRSPPPPATASKGSPPESDRKRDDHNRLLDAVSKRDRGAINISNPSNSSNNDNKKEAEQKKPESATSSFPRKKRSGEEAPEPKQAAKDPSSSILDALNKNSGENTGPVSLGNKVALSPIGASGAGSAGAPPQASGGGGGGGAAPQGGGGMFGGGSASGDGGGALAGDPFSSVGADSGGGDALRMGSGYAMMKDGGYGGTGAAEGGSSYSPDSGFGGEDSESYSSSSSFLSGSRRLTYLEQVKSAEPGSPESRTSILEKYVGYSRRTLCDTEAAERRIGLCESLSSKRKRTEWFRQMEAQNASGG
jgi:hypothetical protein